MKTFTFILIASAILSNIAIAGPQQDPDSLKKAIEQTSTELNRLKKEYLSNAISEYKNKVTYYQDRISASDSKKLIRKYSDSIEQVSTAFQKLVKVIYPPTSSGSSYSTGFYIPLETNNSNNGILNISPIFNNSNGSNIMYGIPLGSGNIVYRNHPVYYNACRINDMAWYMKMMPAKGIRKLTTKKINKELSQL